MCVLCKGPGVAGSLASRLPTRIHTDCDVEQNKVSNGSPCIWGRGTVIPMHVLSSCLFSQVSEYLLHNLFPGNRRSSRIAGLKSPFLSTHIISFTLLISLPRGTSYFQAYIVGAPTFGSPKVCCSLQFSATRSRQGAFCYCYSNGSGKV